MYSGNGSIYKDGYAMGQNAALKQNSMNNAIGGRGKRGRGKRGRGKRGGGDVVVQPVHAPYSNSGIQKLNAELTQVQAQEQANSQFDKNLVKAGGSRRKTNRRSRKSRRSRRSRKSRRQR